MSARPPLRVVVVDDELPARAKLLQFLKLDPRVEVVGEAGDGAEAIEVIEASRPDLVFLDVRMPELDGFGVLEALEMSVLPRIIFVTAFDEFAVRAFQVRALDYLLKPVDPDRFKEALERAIERASDDDLSARIRDAVREASSPGYLERFLVRSRGRLFFVRTDEVEWIEAAGNYVEIHAPERSHLIRGTLHGLEARLDPTTFARIHRSALVNLERVRELRPWSHGDYQVVLESGRELRLSRRFRQRLPRTFGDS